MARYLVLLLPAFLLVFVAGGCSNLSLAPKEVLALSSERSQEIETARGTFTMKIGSGGFTISMGGDYAFEAPDRMYMTIEMFGEQVNVLMALPDFYVEVPGAGWYVVSGDALGIDWEVFEQYVEQQGPVDYSAITEEIEGLQQLPDEKIDGATYLRYTGDLAFADLMDELPEGMIDPEVLSQVSDTLDVVGVDFWIDKETYLPYRVDMTMDFSVPGEADSFSMEMSMLFFEYNQPVNIPQPPADAQPFDALDF